MRAWPRRLAAGLAICWLSGAAAAQSLGPAVPAMEEQPRYLPPPRDAEVLEPPPAETRSEAAFAHDAGIEEGFASLYARHGKPRIAIFWNRAFDDQVEQWYGDRRVVIRDSRGGSGPGGGWSSGGETVVEAQRRVADPGRRQFRERWQWEFEDGFLSPFLRAGVHVVDRPTVVRLAGLDGAGRADLEAAALRGYADMLLELLVAPAADSRTGFELRAKIVDVRTGRVVSYVNSRRMESWRAEGPRIVATDRGFVEVEDDRIGPAGREQWRAGNDFHKQEKPPEMFDVSRNLAHNVMRELAASWR